MGIFDSVLFEGQQADEYKAKKEKEAADKKTAEKERDDRRYQRKYYGNSYSYKSPGAKKTYDSFINPKQYKGEGDRDDYMFISKDDSNRSDNAMKMVKDERNKRWDAYDKSSNDYFKATDDANKSKPSGDRPKGLFKGKEKMQYDKQVEKHNTAKEKADEHKKKMESDKKSYYRAIDNGEYAVDAANRHLRRHGSKNESVGIFESVELV